MNGLQEPLKNLQIQKILDQFQAGVNQFFQYRISRSVVQSRSIYVALKELHIHIYSFLCWTLILDTDKFKIDTIYEIAH